MPEESIYCTELKINLSEIIDPYPHEEPCFAPINPPLKFGTQAREIITKTKQCLQGIEEFAK